METPHNVHLDDASSRASGCSADETPGTPRTLVISDVRLFREGLALGLKGRDDVALIGTAESLDTARAVIAAGSPDVALLDTGMARALELTRALARADGAVKIVGVGVADAGADVVACGEAGMAGFVHRNGSLEDVVSVIHSVMRDELECSPRMTATLFKRLASNGDGRSSTHNTPPLTPREAEVVVLIDAGFSNKQIAQRLSIGTATVKNHVHSILEKLHVKRRAEAAAHVRASQATLSSFSRQSRGATQPADATG
jgi:two-component system, NarL family, nitrate/nitrite response regulator NarL